MQNHLCPNKARTRQNSTKNTKVNAVNQHYHSDHDIELGIWTFAKLSLFNCSITEKGCAALVSALKSNPSHLRELNLGCNRPGESGVKLLSDLLEDPHCKLEKLQLWDCNLTERSCAVLSPALSSNSSSLRELNLGYNELHDRGVKLLSAALKNPHCKLEKLEQVFMFLTSRDQHLAMSFRCKHGDGSYVVFASTERLRCFECGDIGHTQFGCAHKAAEQQADQQAGSGGGSVAKAAAASGPDHRAVPACAAVSDGVTGPRADIVIGNLNKDEGVASDSVINGQNNSSYTNAVKPSARIPWKAVCKTDRPVSEDAGPALEHPEGAEGGVHERMGDLEEAESDSEVESVLSDCSGLSEIPASLSGQPALSECTSQPGTSAGMLVLAADVYPLSENSFLRATKGKRNVSLNSFFPDSQKFIRSVQHATKNETLELLIFSTSLMHTLRIGSLNTNGARDVYKREVLAQHIRLKKLNVVFVQETHSDEEDEVQWRMWWKRPVFLSNGTKVSAGLAILVSPGTSEIRERAVEFYSDLYKAVACDDACVDALVADLPRLTMGDVDSLELPLMLDELQTAVSQMAPGRAPGIDGLFYKTFWEQIGHDLFLMLTECIQGGGS
ncbi:hypothetical protein NFI96_022783 [Prochilodus magdalenae]|nr:hypothetical protein NFI96_022783 [Prochilodus magdalenae]